MGDEEKILHTLELDFEAGTPKWPDHERYPINNPDNGDKIRDVILKLDLASSKSFLLITGFTSLSQIVEVFGTEEYDHIKSVRILLGNDPILRKRKKYPFGFIPLDMKEYWLDKGLSLWLGSSVMRVIQKLENGSVSIRFKKKSHAKIYVGDEFASVGSSNFSQMGLELQQEANIRLSDEDNYNALKKIAENYYYDGRDYKTDLVGLLKQLLADVTWQEALARAIAEVLEGKWFLKNNSFYDELSNKKFWGTQDKGLIEAINILIDKGNVLIADPTGSGKTRMCAAIMISFVYWLWEIGEMRKTNLLLFTPPIVGSSWQNELRDLEYLNYTLRSTGMLSNTTDTHLQEILKDLEVSKILVVDEAHNLLNPLSNRSRNLAQNKADFKILITATPINKKLEDLIRIIELLDIDNLKDSDFELYKEIKENRLRGTEKEDIEKLKSFIDPFLVRRTKTDLNKIISQSPGEYLNRNGNPCKFPKVNDLTYETLESDEDKRLAQEISKQASELKGINYLMSFTPPEYLIKDEDQIKRYVEQRLNGAKNLSIYNIRASLRSSKMALLEYLQGTDYVNDRFKLKSNKNQSGNIIEKIKNCRNSLPEFNFESELIPHWLQNQDQFIKACDEELALYDSILSLIEKLSLNRERCKVDEIIKALKKHNIVIAFDSKLITLDLLNKELNNKEPEVKTYVATGSNKSIVDTVLKVCGLGSSHKNVVVFCSDMMSEGVNLQSASCLILLDLPSVVRLVEQRIGRIDRMDSEHKKINVLWPDDSEEYSLKGDKRLIQTSAFVDSTIGGNFHIPYSLRHRHFQNVEGGVSALQSELAVQKGDKGWEGNRNFFKPIETLRSKFIEDELYEQIKDVKTQVRTRVSFYDSDSDWCFICTRGSEKESPKWLFLKSGQAVITEFSDVAELLTQELQQITERLPWNQDALNSFLREFRGQEKRLLPEKKKRALKVAERILNIKHDKERNEKTKNLLRRNLSLFTPKIRGEITDFYSLSEIWLEILMPALNKERERRINRRKALNLNHLVDEYKKVKLTQSILTKIIEECPKTENIDHKIAACIVGVKASNLGTL